MLANIINGDAPEAMAKTCAELNIPLIHISTDYVFDGTGSKIWKPYDINKPKNAYGRSKLRGELAIKSSGAKYVILRTSWVISPYGKNFVTTMMRLSKTNDSLKIVSDQVGGPTPAQEIAKACIEIAHQMIDKPSKSGVYHFSGSPDVSWYELACTIFEKSKKKLQVRPIPTSQFLTAAVRPLNSRLDCSSLEKTFGIYRPNWKLGLEEILFKMEKENERA